MPSAAPTAPKVRRRALIVPREHGAWGILLVPLVTGAGAGLRHGGSAAGLAPLAIATLALFWLRTPVESWAGASPMRARSAEEMRLVRRATAALAAVAAAALAWLFAGGERGELAWIGAAAAAAFVAQDGLRRLRARTAAQMVGAAGLTSTTAAAYFVTTGRLDGTALLLWAANLLFAANQIWFVQLRIHHAMAKSRGEKIAAGRGFLAGQAATIALWPAGVLPWPVLAAFAPALARGFAWFATSPAPLDVRRLGKSELAHACVFGILLIAAT